MLRIASLKCRMCQRRVPPDEPEALCPDCGAPLTVSYAMADAPERPAAALERSPWRYAAVLPEGEPVTLGEGGTPLVRSSRSAHLWWKRESLSVCGVVAARGLAVTASVLRRQGCTRISMTGTGAEAIAFCMYAAVSGMEAYLRLTSGTDPAVEAQCRTLGAVVSRDDQAPAAGSSSWQDLSHPEHPLRIEGDKTLGYEIAEALGWQLPDAVICPPGVAEAVAESFEEMDDLGWLTRRNSVRLFVASPSGAHRPAADSGVECVETTMDERAAAMRAWAAEGLLPGSHAAACAAACRILLDRGELTAEQTIVLVEEADAPGNAGEADEALGLRRPVSLPPRMPVGGIITPQ